MVEGMSRVARYAKLIAHDGRGGEIAEHLLSAAEDLGDDPGCELYLVNRARDEPDVIWSRSCGEASPTLTRRSRRFVEAKPSRP